MTEGYAGVVFTTAAIREALDIADEIADGRFDLEALK